MMTIQEAYEAFKAGKNVIVGSKEKCRMTAIAKKYYNKPIPMGCHFMNYVHNYQYWTNTHPIFKLENE